MSNWFTRFDDFLVRPDELRRLDHRTRVAWGYYGVAAVALRMSTYFVEESGLALALRCAETFIVEGVIDGKAIAAANTHLLESYVRLEKEGYENDEFLMAAYLNDSIQPESALVEHRVSHAACDPACEDTVGASEWSQSKAGVVYSMVMQWIHGVGACKLSDESVDGIMAQFYQFGRALYDRLAADPTRHPLLGKPLDVALAWDIPGPIEAEMRRTQWKQPPKHERP